GAASRTFCQTLITGPQSLHTASIVVGHVLIIASEKPNPPAPLPWEGRGNRRSIVMVGKWRAWLQSLSPDAYARRQPLVLVNGLAEQAESWFRNHRFWRKHFDVHMPNILAYEGEALHRRIEEGLPISVDYLVEQLHFYLENFVQAPPYHLVGASLGGKVVIE